MQYVNKNLRIMVIFLLWIGLVCCAVANGLIYDHVNVPDKYYYMMIVCLVAAVLLVVHRIYTKHWYPIKDVNSQHGPIFIASMFTSFVVGGSSLFAVHVGEVSWGFSFGCLTGFILFGIAASKENSYI